MTDYESSKILGIVKDSAKRKIEKRGGVSYYSSDEAGALATHDQNTFIFIAGGNIVTEKAQELETLVLDETVAAPLFDVCIDVQKAYLCSTALSIIVNLNERRQKLMKLDGVKRRFCVCIGDEHHPSLERIGISPKYDEQVFFCRSLDEMLKASHVFGIKRILEQKKLGLPENVQFEGKHLELIANALGITIKNNEDSLDRRDIEKLKMEIGMMEMEGYLKQISGDEIAIPSERKYSAISYLQIERKAKEAGILNNGFTKNDLKEIVWELTQNSWEHGYKKNDKGIVCVTSNIIKEQEGSYLVVKFMDYGQGESESYSGRVIEFFGNKFGRRERVKVGGHGTGDITGRLEKARGKFERKYEVPSIIFGTNAYEVSKNIGFTPEVDEQGKTKGTTATIKIPIFFDAIPDDDMKLLFEKT